MLRQCAQLLTLVLSLVVVVLPSSVGAQDATPTSDQGSGDHPLVGSWEIDTNADDPTNPPALLVVHADGTLIELHEREPDGAGAWTATSERTASLTIVFHEVDEVLSLMGTVVIRATAEVSADGSSFTAPYSVEFIAPDGTSEGELDQGTAVGSRIMVEPMRTPVAGPRGADDIGSVRVEGWTCDSATGPVDVESFDPDPAVLAAECVDSIIGATFSLDTQGIARRRVAEPGRPAQWPAVEGPFTLQLEDTSYGDAIVVCTGDGGETVALVPSGGEFVGEVASGEQLNCSWYALGVTSLVSPEAGGAERLSILIIQVVADDGVTPVGGACLSLEGPEGTYALCDNGEGDIDPTLGLLEVDAVMAGTYEVTVQSPDGYVATEVPSQVQVDEGQVTMLSVVLRDERGQIHVR